jgi:hypothetical protein
MKSLFLLSIGVFILKSKKGRQAIGVSTGQTSRRSPGPGNIGLDDHYVSF